MFEPQVRRLKSVMVSAWTERGREGERERRRDGGGGGAERLRGGEAERRRGGEAERRRECQGNIYSM